MRRRRPLKKFGSLSGRRRRIFFIRLTFLALIGSLTLLFAVWFSHRPQFQIKYISIRGMVSVLPDGLEELIDAHLAGSVIGLFPRSNVLFVSREKIRDVIMSSSKRIKAAHVETEGLHSLIITLDERLPRSLWCRPPREAVPEQCFYMDAEGFVFDSAPNFNQSGYTRFYGFLGEAGEPYGKTYLSPERFREITSFLGALKAVDLAASSFTATSDGEYHISLERGTKLMLNSEADFDLVLGNISSLISDPELKELFQRNPLPFEYIDLRLGNKVFYRKK